MSAWHIVNISVAVLSMLTWTTWMLRNKDRWRFAVTPMTYLIHVVLFYFGAASHRIDPFVLNMWSNGVRLHGLILTIAIAVALICAEGCRSWKHPK